jgi:NTE family protein
MSDLKGGKLMDQSEVIPWEAPQKGPMIEQELPDKDCKKALVLSGGGARGSFQFAALKSLREAANTADDDRYHNLFDDYDLIAGVSVGALNAVMVAMGKDFPEPGETESELERVWKNISPEQVHNHVHMIQQLTKEKQPVHFYLYALWRALTKPSLAGNQPLRARLSALFHPTQVKTEVRVGAVSLMTGDYVIFRCLPDGQTTPDKQFQYGVPSAYDDPIIWEPLVPNSADPPKTPEQIRDEASEIFKRAVIASTTMPIIWAPIDVKSPNGAISPNGSTGTLMNMVDGGIRTVSPLADVLREDPELVVIINCGCKCVTPKKKRKGLIPIALRSLVDISINEVMRNDIDSFLRISGILEQYNDMKPPPQQPLCHRDGRRYKYFSSVVIQPELHQCNGGSPTDPVGDSLDFMNDTIVNKNWVVGEAYGKKAFEDFEAKYR